MFKRVILFSFVVSIAVFPDNPHVWKTKVNSVSVFKNGLGFFMREGNVKLRDGWCSSKEIPPAAFGTLAIYAHNQEEMVDIVGSGKGQIIEFDDFDAATNKQTKQQRLSAFLDLKVQLTYEHRGKEHTTAGKLLSVNGNFAILEAEAGNIATTVESISKVQVLELPIRIHVKNAQKSNTTLGMAYLRKGITWIPEYTLKIVDDHHAELTLRGTLVNEAEDLVHCNVNFVVGVPHFVHTNYMAPIAVGQVIRTIGTTTAPQQIQRQLMNRAAIVSNRHTANQFNERREVVERNVEHHKDTISNITANLPTIHSSAGTDYTVYTKENLTVRRGEKAIVTLFVKKIRYSHIYRWSGSQKMRHFLVLHNQTPTAWTTGPCLAVSNGNPLSEDLLHYTPVAGKCELPVTTAINIAHNKEEREIERKLKSHNPQHSYWLDLVTLEGHLDIINFEKEDATIVINTDVSGKPIFASLGGKFRINTHKLKLQEREGSVHWQIKLKPGEKKTLIYRYEKYVSSH